MACAMMRARILTASMRASASSWSLNVGCGGGASRNARVSCMATLLVGRWRCLRHQTVAEDSVHEGQCAEQICQRREAGLAVGGAGFERVIGVRLPVGPTRGNERTAAI